MASAHHWPLRWTASYRRERMSGSDGWSISIYDHVTRTFPFTGWTAGKKRDAMAETEVEIARLRREAEPPADVCSTSEAR